MVPSSTGESYGRARYPFKKAHFHGPFVLRPKLLAGTTAIPASLLDGCRGLVPLVQRPQKSVSLVAPYTPCHQWKGGRAPEHQSRALIAVSDKPVAMVMPVISKAKVAGHVSTDQGTLTPGECYRRRNRYSIFPVLNLPIFSFTRWPWVLVLWEKEKNFSRYLSIQNQQCNLT